MPLAGAAGGADASPEDHRAFDRLEDLAQGDLLGRPGERIAANGAAVRGNQVVPPELLEGASQKVGR